MSEIHLKIKTIGGADIKKVLDEMKALSKRIGVTVETKFNGAVFWVNEDSDIYELMEGYKNRDRSKGSYNLITD